MQFYKVRIRMKNINRLVCVFVLMIMLFSLCACSSNEDISDINTPTNSAEAVTGTDKQDNQGDVPTSSSDSNTDAVPTGTDITNQVTDTPAASPELIQIPEEPKVLVVGSDAFERKFSPFFSTMTTDLDVVDLMTGSILVSDRAGAVLTDAMNGKTISYNGTDYNYMSMGKCDIVENADGTIDYNLTMRDDIYFSDGVKADIDDVIFTVYVMSDPSYNGRDQFYSLPIVGMSDYYYAMAPLYSLLTAAGRENEDFLKWTKDEQDSFWSDVDAAGEQFAQAIVEFCVDKYIDYAPDYIGEAVEAVNSDDLLKVKLGMYLWGYDTDWFEGATAADFWNAIVTAYNGSVDDVSLYEAPDRDTTLYGFISDFDAKYGKMVTISETAKSIAGIKKTGDYSMTITTEGFSANTIYQLLLPIIPLHYYGNESMYDYENESFGFSKGNLDSVRNRDGMPLGCGPYVFESFEDGIVTMKANENYVFGKPSIDAIIICESDEAKLVEGIAGGVIDVAQPRINDDTINAVMKANSNGQLSGDVITSIMTDFGGYGYIGCNASLVKVGSNPGSYESKCLRKGFMTLLSVYRDAAVNNYYGERASVIQYPVSNTSWAAPRPNDAGFRTAYSTDVDGKDIFTDDMDENARYEAALKASVGYFKAAGYTWDEEQGMFTAAPDGAAMEYEIFIPGGGTGDHPSCLLCDAASAAFAQIGITLKVNDLGTSSWTTAFEENIAPFWAAAWQAAIDPDMYQLYYSGNAYGENANSNHYRITDEELDNLILEGRSSADTEFRKGVYKKAMDVVLDWGVELPLYQRKNITLVSTERVDIDSLPGDITYIYDWNAEIEKLRMK